MNKNIYIFVFSFIIIVACQVKQENVEDFGVMKRGVKHVKRSFKYGIFVIKNTLGAMKDFVTFNWI